MRIPLTTDEERRAFEREIVALVARSHLLRAEYLVVEAIAQSGSEPLNAVSGIAEEEVRIEGWEALAADLLEADARLLERTGRHASLAILSLVNRALVSGGFVERLEVERVFYVAFERLADGQIRPERDGGYERPILEGKASVFVAGLEPLMSVQRRPWPGATAEAAALRQFQIDDLLSGLLLTIKFHRLIDRYLETPGLPMPLSLLIEIDKVGWSMEAGVHDLGPQARRFVPSSPPSLDGNAASELLAERQTERRARLQAEVNRSIAEVRELYRLVRMFPFYRRVSRDKLADMLTAQLRSWCQGQNLPAAGVGWRMRKPDFERLLRQFAEARAVAVDDALDPHHVDALHARWLATARRLNFDLGTAPLSIFELGLAVALTRGGPIVQDRWEHAGPYRTG